MLMSGRIILTISRKGQEFPGIRSPPIFWPFMVGFCCDMGWYVIQHMLMYYNECIIRLKVYWKSNLTPS